MEKFGDRLNELHLNTFGKVFFATVALALVGKIVSTKIRGSRDQVDTIANAIVASKAFQDELNKPGATAESVIEKLRIKQMSAQEFERKFNVPWPL